MILCVRLMIMVIGRVCLEDDVKKSILGYKIIYITKYFISHENKKQQQNRGTTHVFCSDFLGLMCLSLYFFDFFLETRHLHENPSF